MKKTLSAVAVTIGCLTGSAQATAIFTWQSVNSAPFEQPISAAVHLSDAALAVGRASVNYTRSSNFTNAPIELVRFQDLFNSTVPTQFQGRGGFGVFWDNFQTLQANLTVSGELLLGSIAAQTENDEVSLASNADGLWLLNRYASENPSLPCRADRSPTNAPFCSGSTGRFVLTSSLGNSGSGRVPAPGVVPLMALAAFGMAAGLRGRAHPTFSAPAR